MIEHEELFLKSALAGDSVVSPTEEIMPWFWSRRDAHEFVIEQIPFSAMDRWGVEPITGNLMHESGSFFSIEGLQVKTNYGIRSEWQQPVINQPEIGFLGILAKQFDGVLHFLMQVKMEPGNINMVQLSPTLQATRSNYTGIHKGRAPSYLEYFFDLKKHRVLVDSFQSEQGGRFFRKRNRNIIIEVEEDVPVLPDFKWMTLGQVQHLLSIDNIVNMDTRTVIGCIPFGGATDGYGFPADSFRRQLMDSALSKGEAFHSYAEIRSWFTSQKFRFDLDVSLIPLNEVSEWEKGDFEIYHQRQDYFSIIACRIEAGSREVVSWTQPLVKAPEPGLVAMVTRRINGVLHCLVQAKVEPGIFDVLEMAPTVQCTTGRYRIVPKGHEVPFLDYVLNVSADQIKYDALLSEEGGRFYQEANRNVVIDAGDDFPLEVPENYIWMTLRQLKEFVKYHNHLNVECRCLLSCLAFLDPQEVAE